MNYNIINIDVKNSMHKNRQFCVNFKDALVCHKDPKEVTYPEVQHVQVIHEGKEVMMGLDKQLQKVGQRIIYKSESIIEEPPADFIEDDVFLLYDNAGENYIHFFFDMFGRCYYFEELLKNNPNLKLGVLEDFYQEEGRNNFAKQWLDLYLEDKNIELVIFKKDKKYKVKNLILSNLFYWFPEQYGHEPILEMIKKVADKIPPIEVKSNGAYISRQDTIKRGWYHKKELKNEKEFIERVKNDLGYDILEMMDYTMKEKIQLTKSYKNIIQQSSASNINILFAAPESNSIILSNPKMGPWLNGKCEEFSHTSRSNLLLIDNVGEIVFPPNFKTEDQNNYPWTLTNIDGLIDTLHQINNNSIWES